MERRERTWRPLPGPVPPPFAHARGPPAASWQRPSRSPWISDATRDGPPRLAPMAEIRRHSHRRLAPSMRQTSQSAPIAMPRASAPPPPPPSGHPDRPLRAPAPRAKYMRPRRACSTRDCSVASHAT